MRNLLATILLLVWLAAAIGCGKSEKEIAEEKMEKARDELRAAFPGLAQEADRPKSSVSRDMTDAEQDYLSQLLVENVTVKDTHSGKEVHGEIRNNGASTLIFVEILVEFLDESGQPMHETEYPALYVENRMPFRDRHEPLKPNFSKKWGMNTKSVSDRWAGGVKVSIRECRLQ
jgi:membrane-associated HD superfamily phosphohydrolase